MKNFTRKPCPDPVRKESLASYANRFIYVTIFFKRRMYPTKENIKELRQKYINNPPEGMTPKDIRRMSDEELLDMEYFLNEDLDDIFEEGEGFFIF